MNRMESSRQSKEIIQGDFARAAEPWTQIRSNHPIVPNLISGSNFWPLQPLPNPCDVIFKNDSTQKSIRDYPIANQVLMENTCPVPVPIKFSVQNVQEKFLIPFITKNKPQFIECTLLKRKRSELIGK